MNVKYIKIGAITLASLGAIYGGYKLVKYLSKPSDEGDLPVDIVDTSRNEVSIANKPTFSGTKIVSKGSKGDEAKTIQQTLNNIIKDAKKGLAIKPKLNLPTNTASQNLVFDPLLGWFNTGKPSSISTTSDNRLKQVASLKPLTVDGDFGAKSVSTLIVIMGKSSATYNEVRDKRIQFSKNYGLGNPYAKK
jgi:hypothetical protein